MASVKNALSKIINISNYFYWTDSKATLAWITSKFKDLKLLLKTEFEKSERTLAFLGSFAVKVTVIQQIY